MQDTETREVIDRFWQAYDHLREINGRGWQTEFIKKVGSNEGHFLRLKRERERMFPIQNIVVIVKFYKVDPMWLITGRGEMFRI